MKQVKITSLALLLVAYLILYYALTASILFLLITPLHLALAKIGVFLLMYWLENSIILFLVNFVIAIIVIYYLMPLLKIKSSNKNYALCLLIFAAVFTLIKFSLAPIDVWVLLIYVLVSALGVNLANLLISKRLAN